VLSQTGLGPKRRSINSPTSLHSEWFWASGASRTNAARCPYADKGPSGQGTTRMASLFRFGNETTSPLCWRPKCSANASRSGWLANPGLSSRTNSNGRPTEAALIGGVSQRNAENGASASRLMKKARKTGSSCHRRKRRNPYRGQDDASAAGRRIFTEHCAQCYGEEARGTKKRPPLRRARTTTGY
jgi:hypothetical protein